LPDPQTDGARGRAPVAPRGRCASPGLRDAVAGDAVDGGGAGRRQQRALRLAKPPADGGRGAWTGAARGRGGGPGLRGAEAGGAGGYERGWRGTRWTVGGRGGVRGARSACQILKPMVRGAVRPSHSEAGVRARGYEMRWPGTRSTAV